MKMEYCRMVKIIVFIDSVLFTLCMIVALVIMSAPQALVDWFADPDWDEFERKRSLSFIETVLNIIGAVLIIYLLFNLLMITILYYGTMDKSVTKLKTWYITTCILTGLIVFETIFVSGYWGLTNLLTAKLPHILFILYRIVSIHIVRRFIWELDRRPRDNVQTVRFCTDESDK